MFLPDRMSLLLSLEMDWEPWHPRDPTNCALPAPTLLLNTIRLLHPQPQAVLFQQQATPVRLTGEGCGGRFEATLPISSLPDRRRKFLWSCPSSHFFSGSGRALGDAIYAPSCCLCPSFTSSCKSNPLTHSLHSQVHWAQIFGTAGSSI